MLTKTQARTILIGLSADGLAYDKLTKEGRAEMRAAIDCLLDCADAKKVNALNKKLVRKIDGNPRTTKGIVLLTTPEWDTIKNAILA